MVENQVNRGGGATEGIATCRDFQRRDCQLAANTGAATPAGVRKASEPERRFSVRELREPTLAGGANVGRAVAELYDGAEEAPIELCDGAEDEGALEAEQDVGLWDCQGLTDRCRTENVSMGSRDQDMGILGDLAKEKLRKLDEGIEQVQMNANVGTRDVQKR